jgi:hypothetical protein
MKKLIISSLFLASISITFYSCKKEKNTDTKDTITSAEDNSTAENEFTSVFDVADDFASNDGKTRSGNTILPNGAVVNFTDSSYTDGDGLECTIDFGPLKATAPYGVLCNDGRYRAGVLHITSTERYGVIGCIFTVSATSTDNYYGGSDGTNMTKLTGTIILTRTTQNSINLKVNNATATNTKGTVSWQSDRTITKTKDPNQGLLGDEFDVTGSASGINRQGDNFTITIDEALHKIIEAGCAKTFVSGKITLTNTTSGQNIKVDYDPYNNKACDLVAKATINSKEYIYFVR